LVYDHGERRQRGSKRTQDSQDNDKNEEDANYDDDQSWSDDGVTKEGHKGCQMNERKRLFFRSQKEVPGIAILQILEV